MKRQKYNNILRGIVATFVFGGFLSVAAHASAQDYDGSSQSNVSISGEYDNIYGLKINKNSSLGDDLTQDVYSEGKQLGIIDGKILKDVYGTYINYNAYNGFVGDCTGTLTAKGNFINITGNTVVEGTVYGTWVTQGSNNNVGDIFSDKNLIKIIGAKINDGIIGSRLERTGGSAGNISGDGNEIYIIKSNIKGNVYGSYIINYTCNNKNDTSADGNYLEINESIIGEENDLDLISGSYVFSQGNGYGIHSNQNEIRLNDCETVYADIVGGYTSTFNGTGKYEDFSMQSFDNKVYINNSKVFGEIIGGFTWSAQNSEYNKMLNEYNLVDIKNSIVNNSVYGGYGCSKVGYLNNYCEKATDIYIKGNKVTVSGFSVLDDIYGGYGYATGGTYGDGNAVSGDVYVENNNIVISDDSKIINSIYAGFGISEFTSDKGKPGEVFVNNNTITLQNNADLFNANLYGSNLANTDTEGNDLIIAGWKGKVNSANNFNNIKLQNLNWQNEGTVLEIGSAANSSLANTNINLISIAGGQKINAGDYMYIIKGNGDLKIDEALIDKNFSEGVVTAGVATEIDGEAFVDDDGNIQYKVNGTSVNDQIDLVAENRAVAAAFVNQGTDLINDSLDVLSRDGKYGIKTFAAVHGNRSKYDVNSDLKINGWSSIVGVGNEKNIGNGDFSWGVFYENGNGNYRTYNEFNNEFFRGDGSLVYNGGGIAARFEQDNGVYTEGSLRAGMLKSEMTNALKDGAGNSYGYKSESSYYGAHIGVGKIISLNEATDLDVYGKFFHTYTDGDSFTVANDKFEFDSITSDRLRIGARLTTNKENKFSTYYGLAYEYEFNGDADMRAQNMSAPEQTLKGSSCMAEIGMNYKPSSESPWSFDLSMRGYAGQRDGFSGNVQATYTF